MKIFVLLCGFVLAGAGVLSADDALLSKIDRARNFEKIDLSCKLSVATSKTDGTKELVEGKYFRRDRDDKFSMILTAPTSSIGQGYLQAAENVWFYDPETRAFTHRSLKDSFQNSKAKNDDFKSPNYERDYTIVSSKDGTIKTTPVSIIEIKAKSDLVPYSKQILWVEKSNNLIMKQECYGASGKLLVTYAYPSYSKVQGTFVPDRIFIKDELRPKENTEITLKEISVANLPDSYFTKQFLESASR